mmetsp:Transcript_16906/g.23417  ORF Transcript_16906/g.23417 Transcript_16906/m.23417 type:complete len:318 (+) Transcript_16906:98-1051(+)|eukprot:CAMPEP_0201481562 /NCGR_PEP_ID=MMETSP0151_2-20130828/5837_1 /ASSEMBLY_ACC=CAM_ASM_000257 /TAXON_ID=200890 /ORGANISM="Paramoeba atlantica, Strain 621/1 / CCAP 1560/9" /LENGTH=317 /DNA_ID=CAMNT_0047863831 /DNA_START=86 /DNA_END=1039 /DNA_ORIENTATION=-
MAEGDSDPSSSEQDYWTIFYEDLISGTVAGVLQTLVGHPLDTIKTRLQTQPTDKHGRGLKYSGLTHCFRNTLREERIFGLYKGMISPLSGLTFLNAILFASYGFARNHFITESGDQQLTLTQVMLCGTFAGTAQCVVVCPMELIKTRLQTQYVCPVRQTSEYHGNIDCIKKTIRLRGYKGLFAGMYGCLIRELPAYAMCFTVYEAIQRGIAKRKNCDKDDLGAEVLILAGGLAGIACWTVSYPQDMVLNRLRVQPIDKPPIYRARYYDGGFWECARQLYFKEGLKGYWKGYSACALRAFPANAASFFGYKMTKDLLF